ALETARRQQSRAWELRATLSLARLLQRRGRRGEAHTAPAAVYRTCTEGFTTPDLVGAPALLSAPAEELPRPARAPAAPPAAPPAAAPAGEPRPPPAPPAAAQPQPAEASGGPPGAASTPREKPLPGAARPERTGDARQPAGPTRLLTRRRFLLG